MPEPETPPVPTRSTINPQMVKGYEDGGMKKTDAKLMVYKDLTLMRRDNTVKRLKKENEGLIQAATIDPLTGLFNRRFLDGDEKAHPPIIGELERLYQIAQRSELPLGAIMCDIDYFKGVNDTYGHPAGDEILKKVAQLIHVRKEDVVVRYGGDEMLLLLPDTDANGVRTVAEIVRKAVEEYRHHSDDSHKWPDTVTLSLGGTSFDPKTSHLIHEKKQLIEAADTAAKFSKDNGRNRTTLSEETQSGTWQFT